MRCRGIVACSLLAGLAVAAVLFPAPPLLAVSLGIGLAAHFAVAAGAAEALARLWPMALFAGALALLGWLGGEADWRLPARAAAVFLLMGSAARLAPWTEVLSRVRPGGRGHAAILFLFILRHFVEVFGGETRRALTARRMAVTRRYGPGWFASLKWALAGVFRRSLERAERFYAAQALRGLGE